ncbi:MAG: nucleoid occlusion factor SlmA [Gammaproteobacteria bacterium]
MTNKKNNRKQQILEVLAHELETSPGTRITTARLAKAVGVSEAALYRHFPSKAKMFEALIDFAEDAIFGLANRIMEEESDPTRRCENLLLVLLRFAEKNPGITRILVGDALIGENERLRKRMAQLFERLETQFKQILREAPMAGASRPAGSTSSIANLLLSIADGRMCRYVRSGFKARPTEYWEIQWPLLKKGLFILN